MPARFSLHRRAFAGSLLLCAGAVLGLAMPQNPKPLATTGQFRGYGVIVDGGGALASAAFKQTSSLIGMGLLTGAGSAAHYVMEPLVGPPPPDAVPIPANAVDCWAIYE